MERNDIEYFIIECGDPTVPDCIESIRKEVPDDLIYIISNHRSSWPAFNEMIDKSKTKYAFQVDGDQLMYPGFVERIEEYAAKLDEAPKVPLVLFSSYDSFEERNIWASCKIYNMDILRETGVRFKDVIGCDRAILTELRNKGYKWHNAVEIDNPIAIHDLRGCGAPYVFSRFQNRVGKDGIKSVRGFLNIWKERWEKDEDFCSGAALLSCIVPYTHSGEVSRENQKKYPDRQIFENPEENIGIIRKRVGQAIKKLGL